jgi:polysaccharide biosynthesis protein PelG
VAQLAILCVATFLVAVPVYGLGTNLDGPTKLAAVQNALLIGVSWLLIPFLGALRAHEAILVAFGAGAAAMAAFGWALAEPGATALLTGFNVSFALTDAIMMAFVVRRIGSAIHLDSGLLRQLREKWDLPACGLAYALGIWADKAVMWYGSPWQEAPAGGLTMAGMLRTMPSYDTAVFWAQLASIPVVAIAFVHVEPELKTLFGRLYGRIGGQASLRELTAAIQKLRICVISSIAAMFVALAIVATVSVLLSFVFMSQLGLRPSYMSILRISLTAMTFHSSAMFCFVFLLYFDLRRKALLIVAVYAVLNTLLTMAFLEVGQAFYGYGAMIAAAITFVVAFAVLLSELPWLHYHAFITNNSSI